MWDDRWPLIWHSLAINVFKHVPGEPVVVIDANRIWVWTLIILLSWWVCTGICPTRCCGGCCEGPIARVIRRGIEEEAWKREIRKINPSTCGKKRAKFKKPARGSLLAAHTKKEQ